MSVDRYHQSPAFGLIVLDMGGRMWRSVVPGQVPGFFLALSLEAQCLKNASMTCVGRTPPVVCWTFSQKRDYAQGSLFLTNCHAERSEKRKQIHLGLIILAQLFTHFLSVLCLHWIHLTFESKGNWLYCKHSRSLENGLKNVLFQDTDKMYFLLMIPQKVGLSRTTFKTIFLLQGSPWLRPYFLLILS